MSGRRKPAINSDEAPVAGCKLETELKFYGCNWDGNCFEELLADMLANMFPDSNPEQLMYHAEDMVRFAEAIRARAGQGLPTHVIARRLRNMQKNSG